MDPPLVAFLNTIVTLVPLMTGVRESFLYFLNF